MAERARIYADSCCFIDAAKHAIGRLPSNRDTDVWHFRALMEAHKAKDVIIFTSVITVVECTHADGIMDDRVKGLFSRLITNGEYVTLIQPTVFIAEDARNLRWQHSIMLKGADYMHVASALDRKCTEILTTDEKILDAAPKLAAFGLKPVVPKDTNLLPGNYRQDDLLRQPNVISMERLEKDG